jgi:hypothetical protein
VDKVSFKRNHIGMGGNPTENPQSIHIRRRYENEPPQLPQNAPRKLSQQNTHNKREKQEEKSTSQPYFHLPFTKKTTSKLQKKLFEYPSGPFKFTPPPTKSILPLNYKILCKVISIRCKYVHT